MDSLRVVLTGFGRFHGIEDNPTSRMVPVLKERLAKMPGVEVVLCEVLEVSAQECLRFFKRTKKSCKDAVFVHLGVAAGRTEMCLEQCAYNNADFRCPDERGWNPEEVPIEGAGTDIDKCLTSPLPLSDICANLQGRFDAVRTSDDAGRFICNFIYYQSLMRGNNAVFVHVTPFDVIPMDAQLEFLTALIEQLRDARS
jgi:pyroglutamyl-peptidase